MDFEKIKEILHDCFDDARDVLPFGDDYTFPDFWSWINSREVEIIAILSMVKPEDTSGNSLHKHFVNGSACATHKIKQLPYLQWHEWAESLDKKGIKQVQCDKCKRWLFPEEI